MAPQASRRFHEAGVGSRTGLRLSAVARDQDGFEDLEAFYKASEAALDHQQQAVPEEEDEEDYDSFDEAPFSHRSGVNGRAPAAASSSMTMDIQDSSAPSPRSMLRSARQSVANKGKTSASNVTLRDDDDNGIYDLDLPNLSTGSRSFDLGGMVGDDDVNLAPPTPKRGLNARQATKPRAATASKKGKEKSAPRGRGRVDMSDSEDDRILADLRQRIDSEYGNDDVMSDYDQVPVHVPSPRTQPPKPKSPAKPAIKKRAAAAPTTPQFSPARILTTSRSQPAASTSCATQSPKRKAARPLQKPRQPEPEPEPTMYGEEDYDDDYDEPAPLTLPRSPEQPPKKKRGRPPKSATTNGTSTQSKTKAPTTSKSSASSKTKRNPGQVVQKVRSQPTVTATVFDENGVRRSTRQRFAPLEYWRGERIRYGRPSLPSGTTIDDFRRRPGEDEFEDDPSLMIPRRRVPVLDIKEVIRVPRAPGEGTFSGTTTRPRNTTSHSKMDRKSETPRPPSRTPDLDGLDFIQLDPTENTVHVEDGWDANTLESGLVIDSDGHETTTSIVRTKASLRPMAAAGQEFKFEKLFNCAGLMATGVLHLPPGTRKPTKPSKDNSFVFCVLQGALRATVHRKSFIVGPEGVFQVPAGNNYSLENVCERDLKLFFAQCRKTTKVGEGMGDLTTFTQYSDTSYGTPKAAAAGVGVRQALGNVGGRGREREKAQSEERGAKDSVMTADSDAEESQEEEDDFETSRQVKTKKRVFRRI